VLLHRLQRNDKAVLPRGAAFLLNFGLNVGLLPCREEERRVGELARGDVNGRRGKTFSNLRVFYAMNG